jgi:hypothetical protein
LQAGDRAVNGDAEMLSLKSEFVIEVENLLIWTLSDAEVEALSQRLIDKVNGWLKQARKVYLDNYDTVQYETVSKLIAQLEAT